MSIEALEQELVKLSPQELKEISAIIAVLRLQYDEEEQAKLTRMIDDKDPSHWVSLEDWEKSMGFDAEEDSEDV